MKDALSVLPSFFRIALSASHNSNHPQHKLGSVIIKNGKVIARGYNTITRKHTITGEFNSRQPIHAEVSAIIKCRHKHDLKGATIAVFRQRKDGSLGSARPCSTCLQILAKYGINKVVYTIENGYAVEKI